MTIAAMRAHGARHESPIATVATERPEMMCIHPQVVAVNR